MREADAELQRLAAERRRGSRRPGSRAAFSKPFVTPRPCSRSAAGEPVQKRDRRRARWAWRRGSRRRPVRASCAGAPAGSAHRAAVDDHAPRVERHRHAGGNLDWLASDSAHSRIFHQTKQMTSPPMPSRSAVTCCPPRPLDVDMIAVPMPPRTRGRRSLRRTRRPGLETRLRSVMMRSRLGAVLELDHERVEALALADRVPRDVALFLEEAGDLLLLARGRHLGKALLQRFVPVAGCGSACRQSGR